VIHAGDIIENPVTGERIEFLRTARDTGGELVEIQVTVQPNGFVAAAHLHPKQDERFEILEGEIEFRLDKQTITARPGDVVLVAAGTPHRFRNTGASPARFRTQVRPALQFERLIETMFSLAADGKTSRKGMPNPLRLAVIANAHFDDVRLPFPPAWLQRLGLAMGAPVGRALGYRAVYESAAAPAPLAEAA
jgi:quercetin dioxygenase-like cupin family protein